MVYNLVVSLLFKPTTGIFAQDRFTYFVVDKNQDGKRYSRSPPIDPIENIMS